MKAYLNLKFEFLRLVKSVHSQDCFLARNLGLDILLLKEIGCSIKSIKSRY